MFSGSCAAAPGEPRPKHTARCNVCSSLRPAGSCRDCTTAKRQTCRRPVSLGKGKWSGGESNPRPPECDSGALPAELPPQRHLIISSMIEAVNETSRCPRDTATAPFQRAPSGPPVLGPKRALRAGTTDADRPRLAPGSVPERVDRGTPRRGLTILDRPLRYGQGNWAY